MPSCPSQNRVALNLCSVDQTQCKWLYLLASNVWSTLSVCEGHQGAGPMTNSCNNPAANQGVLKQSFELPVESPIPGDAVPAADEDCIIVCCSSVDNGSAVSHLGLCSHCTEKVSATFWRQPHPPELALPQRANKGAPSAINFLTATVSHGPCRLLGSTGTLPPLTEQKSTR